MVLLIILIQIAAVALDGYFLLLERKYCGHCDWWWDTGAWINFALTLIPVIGIFASMAGCVDYMHNITAELRKRGDEHGDSSRG